MKTVLSVDVAKNKSMIMLMNSDGEILIDTKEIKHNLEAFEKVKEEITEINAQNLTVFMESTGTYHLPIERYFKENGFNTLVINSLTTKNNYDTIRKTKTDKKDCYRLAKLFFVNEVEYHDLSKNDLYANLKAMTRQYFYLLQQNVSCKNRYKRLLNICFPELEKIFKSTRIYDDTALKKNPDLELSYIVAPPRMKYYMQYSTKIVNIYLKWFSIEDIYVYSIDEVFIDVTHYLQTYNCTPRELATKVIQDVLKETGITATCGIGTNMYLAKVAMDIVAKHTDADKYGVRIAGLDELAYRKYLWNHKPLTDFWRVGKGISQKLEKNRMFTMGDVARQSIKDDEKLFKLFGINAELLIDHAWGYEPCTIDSVKSYKPVTNSLSSGQVLKEPYNYEQTRLIVKEMAELLSLDLVKKDLITSKLVLEIGYDVCNLSKSNLNHFYNGEIKLDHYGREVPKHAHGTINIDHKTSSTKILTEKFIELYDEIINRDLYVRRVTLSACDVVNEDDYRNILTYEQMNMFIDYNALAKQRQKEREEKLLQKAVLGIKARYGKNAILKGMNFEKSGTTIERNGQIGGHRS